MNCAKIISIYCLQFIHWQKNAWKPLTYIDAKAAFLSINNLKQWADYTSHLSTKNHPQTVQALRSLRASLEERQSPDQTWDQIVLELELLSAITRVSTCINYTVHCYRYLGLFAKNSHSWYRAVITCALGSQNYIQWLRMRLWDVVRGPHKIAFVQKQGSRRLSARKFVIRIGDKS